MSFGLQIEGVYEKDSMENEDDIFLLSLLWLI